MKALYVRIIGGEMVLNEIVLKKCHCATGTSDVGHKEGSFLEVTSFEKDHHTLDFRTPLITYRLSLRACCLFVQLLTSNSTFQNSIFRKFFLNETCFRDNNFYKGLILDIEKYFYEPIDGRGNRLMEKYVSERQHLDVTMSWLSTLGGAFSALGDNFVDCAVIAGKISIQQLQLAWRLGDPSTVIQCKLYCALSLLQLKKFKRAKSIIRNQYIIVKSRPVVDRRLVSMCLGIWAKLRYELSKY